MKLNMNSWEICNIVCELLNECMWVNVIQSIIVNLLTDSGYVNKNDANRSNVNTFWWFLNAAIFM